MHDIYRFEHELPTPFRGPTTVDSGQAAVFWLVNLVVFVGVLLASIWIYGARDGFVVALLYWPMVSIPSLLGFVPVLGPVLYYWLEKTLVAPTFFNAWFPAIEPSLLTNAMFWLAMAAAVLYTIVGMVVAVAENS